MRTHVFIVDGTLSRMAPGQETNAGLVYKLLAGMPARQDLTVAYDPGIQGKGLWKWINVASGAEINRSILAGYRQLSARYRPGDKIVLFGFSRGAYAVRSIAGMIAKMGLLRRDVVSGRRVSQALHYYQQAILGEAAIEFKQKYGHRQPVRIEMIGVWDTVKMLGLPYPIINRLAPMATEFHNHSLSSNIRNAFQALACDENRVAFTPIPWACQPNWQGRLEQVWFPGAHSDIGGHNLDMPEARPLSNIPLVWMLERAEECGLPLPINWRDGLDVDASAPAQGCYSGLARWFMTRKPRVFGPDITDKLHISVSERKSHIIEYHPRVTGIPSDVFPTQQTGQVSA
ncbi:MAG: DUF2235 domain-containing protein [Rhodobacteraceae bacterium]|nr:DUF2235 domain-containing protein [Paracoccaceae bacterium]